MIYQKCKSEVELLPDGQGLRCPICHAPKSNYLNARSCDFCGEILPSEPYHSHTCEISRLPNTFENQVCEHGRIRRTCQACEDAKRIEALESSLRLVEAHLNSVEMEAAIVAGRDARRIVELEAELDRLRHEVAHPFDAEEVRVTRESAVNAFANVLIERTREDGALFASTILAESERFLGTRDAGDEKEKEG